MTSRALLCFLTVAALAGGAVAQDHGNLYAVDNFGNPLIEIDPTTGSQTIIAHFSGHIGIISELAYNPANNAIYAASNSTHALHQVYLDGTDAQLGPTWGADIFMHGIEWDAVTGTLYGASSTQTLGGTFYTIDPTNGSITLVGAMGTAGFTDIGLDTDTNVMYSVGTGGGPGLYTVDLTTGAATLVSTITGGPVNPSGMAYDPENHTMYITDNSTDALYSLDVSTGAATLITSFTPHPTSNVISLVYLPAPEPATLACLGLGSLALLRRRRRNV